MKTALTPSRFLEFLENYSSDLRDGQRLDPVGGLHRKSRSRRRIRATAKQAPFFYSVFDGLFPETGYAALDFGQYMSLVFLDTNHTSPVGGAQTDWLERMLKEREDCPNVFVVNHVPAYPSHRSFQGDADEPGTGAANRKHWVPLFERYNVDAVFEHHDHTYKRTHPLLDGRPNEKGVLYLGDGSWGRIRKPTDMDTRPYLAVASEDYHVSVHRIEGRQQFHVALVGHRPRCRRLHVDQARRNAPRLDRTFRRRQRLHMSSAPEVSGAIAAAPIPARWSRAIRSNGSACSDPGRSLRR